ncbi:hypothetical protein [Tahibacter amnicola]|uniref:Uncharacterized protein n=1 Tax=Tahibacter amnicola TaxID=2976241 RepID=A0ABY6BD09_9GAMM|nr:hypothetical protein [Tahibacter amnicola]UXI67923.1 hypothetical protein N4264_24875 [Tahibacter amnicola]
MKPHTLFALPALFGLAHLMASLVSATPAATTPSSTPAAVSAIGESTNAILQGDSARAVAALRQVPAGQFSPGDADYRRCMVARYERSSPELAFETPVDGFVRDLLGEYQAYWWRALAQPARASEEESQLLARLHALLGDTAAGAEWDAVETLITRRLESLGFHAQLGRTPPLRDLMVWGRHEVKMFAVTLPDESVQNVPVALLDDFASRGWSYYARCGRGSSGGWATEDTVFAVRPWYPDLESDPFRASLLGHESQHFADKQRYENLADWELEYRAKLTELWMARDSAADLLDKLTRSQGDNPASPHTYANRRVLHDLADTLRRSGTPAEADHLATVAPEKLRKAAQSTLQADTARRTPLAKR